MKEPPQTFDWLSASAAVSKRIGRAHFAPAVLEELRSEQGGRTVLVACSGGADSVCMLCALRAEAAALGLRLVVAHYNHRWRGDASDADARFVGEVAAALGLPLVEEARPDVEAAFTETAARVLRLDFLRRAARRHRCRYIAFGHQLDDILETQLQRLARGCGSEGLAAPRPVARFPGEPTHLRPLLSCRAGDIRMALRAVGVPWCEDSSNADVRISRNALRAEVIPALVDALDRDPAGGAARSRQLLEEDAAALDFYARQLVPQAFAGADALDCGALRALPVAVLRRVLSAWLAAHGILAHFGAAARERLLQQCRERGVRDRHSAGPYFICIAGERLYVERDTADGAERFLPHTEFEPGETIFLPEGASLGCVECAVTPELLAIVRGGGMDPEREAVLALPDERPLVVRGWQAGDRFHPMGAPGSRKLSEWFIDHRVPKAERKRLPLVLTDSGEIIWLPGAPPADRLKLTASTKRALRLTYQRGNSV